MYMCIASLTEHSQVNRRDSGDGISFNLTIVYRDNYLCRNKMARYCKQT